MIGSGKVTDEVDILAPSAKTLLRLRPSHAQLNASDLTMVMHACVALKRCAAVGSIPTSVAPPLVHALEEVMLRNPKEAHIDAWFGAAEQAEGNSGSRVATI